LFAVPPTDTQAPSNIGLANRLSFAVMALIITVLLSVWDTTSGFCVAFDNGIKRSEIYTCTALDPISPNISPPIYPLYLFHIYLYLCSIYTMHTTHYTHYTTLYHAIPHYTTLYHTVPHYTTLYHTNSHYTTLYHSSLGIVQAMMMVSELKSGLASKHAH
jgi:hypothetical protein